MYEPMNVSYKIALEIRAHSVSRFTIDWRITTLIVTCRRSKPLRRIMRSDIYWFAEICNSQCLSHFAASFIASRAEVSIVKGDIYWVIKRPQEINLMARNKNGKRSRDSSTPILFLHECNRRLFTGLASAKI